MGFVFPFSRPRPPVGPLGTHWIRHEHCPDVTALYGNATVYPDAAVGVSRARTFRFGDDHHRVGAASPLTLVDTPPASDVSAVSVSPAVYDAATPARRSHFTLAGRVALSLTYRLSGVTQGTGLMLAFYKVVDGADDDLLFHAGHGTWHTGPLAGPEGQHAVASITLTTPPYSFDGTDVVYAVLDAHNTQDFIYALNAVLRIETWPS